MRSANVFSALSTYGEREAENYLTESFVFLLRLLYERAPESFLKLLNQLVGTLPLHDLTNPELIKISTQKSIEQRRPDIQIVESDNTLVYVEIKHDSPLGEGQLENYYSQLVQSTQKNTRLVLLTRSRSSSNETTLSTENYRHICWYEVYDWIVAIKIDDTVVRYFTDQFLEFLKEKKMNLSKVTGEYSQGIVALVNLREMMYAAAKEALPHAKVEWGRPWRDGVGISLDKLFYIGIWFDHPNDIVFANNNGTRPFDELKFDLEEEHFFALTEKEQFDSLVRFFQQASNVVPKEYSGIATSGVYNATG